MPLWGVENTGNRFQENEISLIWGLVSAEYENNPNVSTVRQPSLYLPGYSDQYSLTTGYNTIGSQNLPGSDFYSQAMYTVYNIGKDTGSTAGQVDYSGEVNMAVRIGGAPYFILEIILGIVILERHFWSRCCCAILPNQAITDSHVTIVVDSLAEPL